MNPTPQCLYITDLMRTGEAQLRKVVTEGCAAGIDSVLLREPQLDSGKLLALAATLRVITHQYHARLIIHSQADIAQAIAADGVHLNAAMIGEAKAMRHWLSSLPITLSTSCHNALELQTAAKTDIDFAFLSPVFTTASHPDASALGVQRFQQLAAESPLPIIALGGITTANRAQLATHPIAVMRAIDEADDIDKAVQLLIRQQAAMTQE